ncbi:hypothetical protein ACOMHN_036198 [Nucella lapillus]
MGKQRQRAQLGAKCSTKKQLYGEQCHWGTVPQGNSGTGEQRHGGTVPRGNNSGTREQRHGGTAARGNNGTGEQRGNKKESKQAISGHMPTILLMMVAPLIRRIPHGVKCR